MSRRSSHLVIAAGVIALIAAAATGVAAIAPAGADESPLSLSASLSARKLTVMRGGEVVKVYNIAIGSERHPTPTGAFSIHRIVWNPAWVPPDRAWARGKTAQGPGDPENPMKVVKIFFQEPDFFIHGTAALGSLGEAASHGCLRMDPDDAGELGLMVMENAGVSRDWDWVKGLLHMGDSHTVSLRDPTRLVIEP